MEPIIKAKNLELTDFLRQYVERKIRKLDRYLPRITECRVELSVENAKSAEDRQVAQITLRSNNTILRAEERSADMRTSIDSAIDKLYRQIDRYKGKRYRGRGRVAKAPSLETAPEEEAEYRIARVKRFQVTPMTEEEAIEQMELLGHDFFVFYNVNTEIMSVIYRRRDGTYGLLEPELA